MNDILVEFVEKIFRPTIKDCQRFCFIVRAIEFQKESVDRLEGLKSQIAEIKKNMVEIKDEEAANCCLSLEDITEAIIHELKMWIDIKEDKMGDAWDELINAEMSADAAISAYTTLNNITDYLQNLSVLEGILFPKIIFVSPGMIINSSRCNICGSEYGGCDHLKGLPYMGQLCVQEITEAKFEEVSIVENPANKHARMAAMTIDGVNRDLLTWRKVPGDPREFVEKMK